MSTLNGFALVLGASSGFGEAAALALAEAGMDIVGVHLDRRSTMAHVEEIQTKIRGFGREAWFYNTNAANDERRKEVLDDVARRLAERDSSAASVRVLLHSLAFGTLRPLLATKEAPDNALTRANLEMTLDVMATSLVYWTQDVVRRGMMAPHGRVYAMTSTGSWACWPEYGAVSAAKAALEAYIRQLAVEGAGHGFTANALCAGVTRTPALEKIPGSAKLIEKALGKNAHGRLTTTEDVAKTLVALAGEGTDWLSGNVINIDGGEAAAG